MRLLAQFVGIRRAYFWWIVTVAAAAALSFLAIGAYPIARAEFEARARRRDKRAAELVRRAWIAIWGAQSSLHIVAAGAATGRLLAQR